MNNMIHIREKDKKTSQWAGGSTVEFFLYPPTAAYCHRNFLFRISSATVNENISTFTSLPGYHRTLLVLEGSMRLVHEVGEEENKRLHHDKFLMPMEQDSFDGGFCTTSYGTCMDFNLMIAKGLRSEVKVVYLKKGEKENLTFTWAAFIYSVKGNVMLSHNNEIEYILEGEMNLYLPEEESHPTTRDTRQEEFLAESEDTIVIVGVIYDH